MALSPPRGITPPAPGLDREEPTFVREDDIPSDDGEDRAQSDRGEPSGERGSREERPLRHVERE
jgi:hypothetical protein